MVSVKSTIATIAGLAVSMVAAAGCSALPPLCLVKDGEATSTIVVPDGCGTWTREAAKWVMLYVAESTGARLKVVPESNAPRGRLVSVGHTQLAKRAGIGIEDLKWDGYKMVVRGNVLYLIGRDEEPLKGRGARGTNRAAVAFLEDFCGVRFFLPTPEGELVPKAKNVSVPRDLCKTFVPAFAFVDGRWPYRSGRPASFAHGYGMSMKRSHNCCHSYDLWVSAAEYYDEHPEYFALVGGKRPRSRHLCTSNPAVKQLLLQAIKKEFDKGFDIVRLGQEDGYQPCQCPRCRSMDNYHPGPNVWAANEAGVEYTYKTLRENPCERLHLLNKWIIDECRKSHPDKLIQLLAYGPTWWPSKEFDRYGDNVIVDITMPLDHEMVKAWRGKAKALSAFIYWGDATMPMSMDVHVTPGEIADTVRFLRDNNFIGFRQLLGNENWGLQGPMIYMLGKLILNPDQDYVTLIAEYCLGVYGNKAGKTMLSFYNGLYARHEQLLPPLSPRGSRRPDMPWLPGLGRKPWTKRPYESLQDVYRAVYPPSFTQELDRLLAKAEQEAETERAKGWLGLTTDYFDFSRFLGGMLTAYAEYEEDPTDEKLREVKEWVDRFEELRERIVTYDDAYVSRWFPGRHDMFCNYLTSDGQGEEIYYAKWNDRKEQVFRKGLRGTAIGYRICGLPRVIDEPVVLFKHTDRPVTPRRRPKEPRHLTVKRATQALKIDGIIEEPEWKEAPPQLLYPLPPTSSGIRTQVRAAYDDMNLYVAWQCEDPQIRRLKLKETGRDGPVWSPDCVELMLNPDARSRSRRFHFVVAPSPDSFYDARSEDPSWNPKWKHASSIDKTNKRWSVEMSIPFEELGAKVPKPGTTWSVNYGRERYAGGLQQPDRYIWSPSRAGGFSDVSGKITFK